MLRSASRTVWAVAATSLALVIASCGSDPNTPGPSPVQTSVAPASTDPTPAPRRSATSSPVPTAIAANHAPGSWTIAAAMGRGGSYGSTATVLNDGRVLVAGGEGTAPTPRGAPHSMTPSPTAG